jgi:hypothetical protein
MRIKLFFVCLVLLVQVSCNGTGVRGKVASLDESIKQYNIALRWAQYEKLDSYHVDMDGKRIGVDREALKDIRITGYEITAKELNDDMNEATVNGVISYYRNDRGTLATKSYDHSWWYDEDIKRWFLANNLPTLE